MESDEAGAEAPTAARVARRALALAALTGRAILEQSGVTIRPPATLRKPFSLVRRVFSTREGERQALLAWISDIGIEAELEPDELDVLQRPIGRLEPDQQINSTWCLEGLGVLAWSLGRFDVPRHDEIVQVDPLLTSMAIFDVQAAAALLASPTLRPRTEIASLRSRLFALHWRVRNYHLHPGVMDFAEFARTCEFGPLDIADLPLLDGDLAICGKCIDQLSPETLGNAHSTAMERHRAANWLWEGPELFSQASEAT